MDLSCKTFKIILTLSICLNIFFIGFCLARGIDKPPFPHFSEFKHNSDHKNSNHKFDKRNKDKKAGFFHEAREQAEKEREKVSELRNEMAEIVTADEKFDETKVRNILSEIKIQEDAIRAKFENQFIEKLKSMDVAERKEFINKMQKIMRDKK